jgi:hypothetical protein
MRIEKRKKGEREIDLGKIIKTIDIYEFPAIANKSLCYTISQSTLNNQR